MGSEPIKSDSPLVSRRAVSKVVEQRKAFLQESGDESEGVSQGRDEDGDGDEEFKLEGIYLATLVDNLCRDVTSRIMSSHICNELLPLVKRTPISRQSPKDMDSTLVSTLSFSFVSNHKESRDSGKYLGPLPPSISSRWSIVVGVT